ncbi:MAG TPA: galactokinase family protein [Armatimonadota bacterium]|nr:galactokinase family protein [Armatimonadota bacterium]
MPADRIQVSAPGRLCLFGEHQDFLGLPVIAIAVTRDITFAGVRRSDGMFVLDLPDISAREEYDPREELPYRNKRDYLPSAINVLRRDGYPLDPGYDITVRGNIPINAGCGSSSAMLNAWIGFLKAAHGGSHDVDPTAVARDAHRAEVIEFDEPGGMMDHYSSALGGLLHIKTEGDIECTPLAAKLDGFVLGDSLTPKNTTGTLAASRAAMADAVEIAGGLLPGFDIHETHLDEARPVLDQLQPRGREMLEGNLINRDICREALVELNKERPDPALFGDLLTRHHEQLSRHIQVSTEKLDQMVQASLDAGALGAKMNGSGGGGCMFAYAPGRQDEVVEAIRGVGARAWPVAPHPGLQVKIG